MSDGEVQLTNRLHFFMVYTLVENKNDVIKFSKLRWNNEAQGSCFTAKFWTIIKKIARKQGFHKPWVFSRNRALNEKHNSVGFREVQSVNKIYRLPMLSSTKKFQNCCSSVTKRLLAGHNRFAKFIHGPWQDCATHDFTIHTLIDNKQEPIGVR